MELRHLVYGRPAHRRSMRGGGGGRRKFNILPNGVRISRPARSFAMRIPRNKVSYLVLRELLMQDWTQVESLPFSLPALLACWLPCSPPLPCLPSSGSLPSPHQVCELTSGRTQVNRLCEVCDRYRRDCRCTNPRYMRLDFGPNSTLQGSRGHRKLPPLLPWLWFLFGLSMWDVQARVTHSLPTSRSPSIPPCPSLPPPSPTPSLPPTNGSLPPWTPPALAPDLSAGGQ